MYLLLNSDLKSQLEELRIANDYHVRLKDVSYSESVKETSEKLSREVDTLKLQIFSLRTEKDKSQTRHEQEITLTQERHTTQLSECESNFTTKIMTSFEKFQELHKSSKDIEENWDERVLEKEREHESSLQICTEENELKLSMKDADLAAVK